MWRLFITFFSLWNTNVMLNQLKIKKNLELNAVETCFCPYTVQWLLARARNTNDDHIACCECEMFVSLIPLTRLSSTERIFADMFCYLHVIQFHFACHMPIWSSLNILRFFFIFYCSTVGLGARGNPSLKMPRGKLVCSYFSHSLSAGIKVNNFTQGENFGCLTVGIWHNRTDQPLVTGKFTIVDMGSWAEFWIFFFLVIWL